MKIIYLYLQRRLPFLASLTRAMKESFPISWSFKSSEDKNLLRIRTGLSWLINHLGLVSTTGIKWSTFFFVLMIFLLHAGAALKSWLRDFLSSCLRRLKIPKIWRRAFRDSQTSKARGGSKELSTNISALCPLQDPPDAYLRPR